MSVFFTDKNTGYAAGGGPWNSTIEKTMNGGNTWTVQNSGAGYNLNSIHFADENTGLTVGVAGTILKTTNGGSSWISQTSVYNTPLNSVFMIDVNRAYIVANNGMIEATFNGGSTWTSQNSGVGATLNSVFFTDQFTGYVVGSLGAILKTINGGGVGINKNESTLNILKFYPSPANNNITVETSAFTGISSLAIVNVYGQELMEHQLTDQKTQIDISSLSPGVYFIRLTNGVTVEVGTLIKGE